MASSSLRILEYLESLPGTVHNKLYQEPSTALAVFSMLPHLDFHHGHAFPPPSPASRESGKLGEAGLHAVAHLQYPEFRTRADTCASQRDEAIAQIQRLHILKALSDPGKPRAYSLTHPFAKSLKEALTGGGKHRSFGVPCKTPEKDRLSISFLDEFARRQWEGVLGYMVGSAEGVQIANQGVEVSEGVKKLLRDGGLVRSKGRTTITQEGFAFVLQDVNAQVWTMLIFYIEAAAEMNMNPVDVLSFLFMLGSLELGQDYSKASLSPTQLQMLEDLSDFGLAYQSSLSSKRFYPTRLVTTLASDSPGLVSSAVRSKVGPGETSTDGSDGGGFIVIETNYRLYAYTSSPLQIAILQLFCHLKVRYPNMVAGKVKRETIRRAVSMGITADQISAYLTAHAHPQMRKNNPVLPPTVVDQIRLWQIEGERMKATTGFLLRDFESAAEYEACCNYARETGVLAWYNDDKRMFFVTRVEQVAAFVKNRPKKPA